MSCMYHTSSLPLFCDVILLAVSYTLILAHGPSFLPISPSPRSSPVYMYYSVPPISSCPYTHSLPWSVGRSCINLFVLLFFLSSLSLLSTCVLQSPTSLLAIFYIFFTTHDFLSFYVLCIDSAQFVCFQCTQRFIK